MYLQLFQFPIRSTLADLSFHYCHEMHAHPTNSYLVILVTPDIELDSVTRYEGQVADFLCSASEEISSVQWIVNGSALEDLNMDTSISILFAGGILTFQNVPLHYSGTTVQCVLIFPDDTTSSSNTAILQVQG